MASPVTVKSKKKVPLSPCKEKYCKLFCLLNFDEETQTLINNKYQLLNKQEQNQFLLINILYNQYNQENNEYKYFLRKNLNDKIEVCRKYRLS